MFDESLHILSYLRSSRYASFSASEITLKALPLLQIVLSSSGPTSLPVGTPLTAFELLSGYVELSQPATTRDIKALLDLNSAENTQNILSALLQSYKEEVLSRRRSVLDVLEDHPEIKVSFAGFLSLLPSMRVRQYSISSSPLWNAQHVTLTISVLEAPPLSGRKEPYLGVASTYLANLRPGDKVQMAVSASSSAFHLPQDPKTPLVLLCAGSGLAPMRGFLQERALQKKAGREVGKALLFFGCRSPDQDYLYHDQELKAWEELGVVELKPAFSKAPDKSEGCKYVQEYVLSSALLRSTLTQTLQSCVA
jgi:cytochrome P450 / NADPH-cytochrome P450 reductase